MLTSPLISGPNCHHGFFTRAGGVSDGIYAGLNCGPGSHDETTNVVENRARAVKGLGLGAAPLITAYQVHSPDAIAVFEPWNQADAPKADALVTDKTGLVIGILTADCAPVLFADVHAGVIGAAHAGWKGAVGGILENTVEVMERLGAKRENISAVIGPCIHQTNYEVGAELRERVLDASGWADDSFRESARQGHYLFDLPGYVRARLDGLSLGGVDDVNADTYGDPDRFFSYRRTTHAGEPDYGRQLSAIALVGG
ncbi:peptidoglycan editing factor PgeF [Pseudomonadota bacterium]